MTCRSSWASTVPTGNVTRSLRLRFANRTSIARRKASIIVVVCMGWWLPTCLHCGELVIACATGRERPDARCGNCRRTGRGGFRREVQPRRQHWFLNEKSGFPFRTPAFCSVSRGQRRLGEKEYRASSVTPGVALRPRTQGRLFSGLIGQSDEHAPPTPAVSRVPAGLAVKRLNQLGTHIVIRVNSGKIQVILLVFLSVPSL